MAEQVHIDEELSKHLSAEDEMGVVIRAHIHVEASVNEFINKTIPHPEYLSDRTPYESRVKLACALGLDNDYLKALVLLGVIRNQFGHKLDAKLSEAKVNELFSVLPESGKEVVLLAYERTKDRMAKNDARRLRSSPLKKDFLLLLSH